VTVIYRRGMVKKWHVTTT